MMINLLLVDDQSLIRQGLQTMLNLEADLEVVGVADNGKNAIQQIEVLQPDVVLMDIRMPVMDGREAIRIISKRFPNVKVLVLSTFDDDRYIADSMQAGAKGYLLKDMPSEELAECIRFVNRGYTQMGPGLMEKFIAKGAENSSELPESVRQELEQLTTREKEVLKSIGYGLTNRDIAKELYIAEGTVKTYVNHLLTRLNLRNRSQLAIYSHLAAKDLG